MRFRVEHEGTNGWTRWIQPRRKGYRVKCCDCGLVHVAEFRLASGPIRRVIQFRVRRTKGRKRRP